MTMMDLLIYGMISSLDLIQTTRKGSTSLSLQTGESKHFLPERERTNTCFLELGITNLKVISSRTNKSGINFFEAMAHV